jgi:hypothetical protein
MDNNLKRSVVLSLYLILSGREKYVGTKIAVKNSRAKGTLVSSCPADG